MSERVASRLVLPGAVVTWFVTGSSPQQIRRKPILGGLINEYTCRLTHGRPAGHLPNPIFERTGLG